MTVLERRLVHALVECGRHPIDVIWTLSKLADNLQGRGEEGKRLMESDAFAAREAFDVLGAFLSRP